MTRIPINGVSLHVEETGSGESIVFVHEFGGDARSWQPQVEHFSRHYRCVVYNARGYLPSDVPEDERLYGQQLSTADLKGVLDALDIEQAFVVGLSMGAYTGLMLTVQHPERVRALVFASGGSGAYPETRTRFLVDTNAVAEKMLQANSVDAAGISSGPSRVQLQNKNQTVWEQFAAHLSEHSAVGSAYTLRHVQAERPSLYDLTTELGAVTTPTLLVVGDEDESCLDVNLYLKRTMPYAGLSIFPKSGHLLNLEEPERFNALIDEFFQTVKAGQWSRRDPRSETVSAFGQKT
ncbi:MAG: alpha/beta hydrolase [Desulfurellaceae bacterium]|nr:alpha/beta hydrolase [Desulfurellaceae bacterium]